MAVGLAGVLLSVSLHLFGRINDLQARLEKLESELQVLGPLVNVMSAHRPGAAISAPYQAVQATGAPDVAQPETDSALAWCPASENSGIEWLELSYEQPVSAAEMEIHESCKPGAVIRVLIGGSTGPLQELPLALGTPLAVRTIPISSPVEISRVKLEIDTAAIPGWNQIDAVGLSDAAGTRHWATSATASSYWSQAQAEEPNLGD